MKKVIFGLLACGFLVSSGANAEKAEISSAERKAGLLFGAEKTRESNLYQDVANFSENLETITSDIGQKVSDIENDKEDFFDQTDKSEDFQDLIQKSDKLRTKLETRKLDIEARLIEFGKIKRILDKLDLSEKIDTLNGYVTKLDNMRANLIRQQSKIRTELRKKESPLEKESVKKEKLKEVNWNEIRNFENELRGFNSALQKYNIRLNTILRMGHNFFDDTEKKSLFDPSQKMQANLKGLFKQIYDVRYPEAREAWSDIKDIKDSDQAYDGILNKFRAKMGMLHKNVSSLLKQGNPKKQVLKGISDHVKKLDLKNFKEANPLKKLIKNS